MISRRTFLLASAGTLAGCGRAGWLETTPQVHYPGMQEGHFLRDRTMTLPAPSNELKTGVAIVGSGIAGLTTAWKLAKEGFKDFVVISGPEFGGNASGGQFGDLRYPCGAHYLPLPSMESTHVREMLFDFGVILRDPASQRPYFDESCVVHAPDERLYFQGSWQEGLLPNKNLPASESAEHKRFLSFVEALKSARGADGRKLFAIPVALSSNDPTWTRLDKQDFRSWLLENRYSSPTLHWYLNYVCRDEYGAGHDRISAWMGLHYFASRAGQAANASEGAVLTWPDGLNPLVRKLSSSIQSKHASAFRPGYVARIEEGPNDVKITCIQGNGPALQASSVKAKRVVCAMPLYIASHVADLSRYGFDAANHLPTYAPWMVSNFLLDGFPVEETGAPLAWDNVVYGGKGLGYVVSTHQDIRVAAPPKTVFSAYQALSSQTPSDARRWLVAATPEQLYETAASDLKQVYGFGLKRHV